MYDTQWDHMGLCGWRRFHYLQPVIRICGKNQLGRAFVGTEGKINYCFAHQAPVMRVLVVIRSHLPADNWVKWALEAN